MAARACILFALITYLFNTSVLGIIPTGCIVYEIISLGAKTTDLNTPDNLATITANSVTECEDACTTNICVEFQILSSATTTCYMWTQTAGTAQLKLDTAATSEEVHKVHSRGTCPTYDLYDSVSGCEFAVFMFHTGRTNRATTTTTSISTLVDCLDLCAVDHVDDTGGCQSAHWDSASSTCYLYDADVHHIMEHSFIEYTVEHEFDHFYVLLQCTGHDAECGFHLSTTPQAGDGFAVDTATTHDDCWDKCHDDYLCYGFDMNESNSTCIRHDETTYNGTGVTTATGWRHHTLNCACGITETFTTTSIAEPAAECLIVTELYYTKRGGLVVAGEYSSHPSRCLYACLHNITNCIIVDFHWRARPFIGHRCLSQVDTSNSLKVVSWEVINYEMVSTVCPTSSITTYNGYCIEAYADYTGAYRAEYRNLTASAVVLDCWNECIADARCHAVSYGQFGYSTLCRAMDNQAAYIMKASAGHTHYVITSC